MKKEFEEIVWQHYLLYSGGSYLVRYKSGNNPGWYAGFELGRKEGYPQHGPYPTKERAIAAAKSDLGIEEFDEVVWQRYLPDSNDRYLVRYKVGNNPGWYAGRELGIEEGYTQHGPFPTEDWAIVAASYFGFGESLPEAEMEEILWWMMEGKSED